MAQDKVDENYKPKTPDKPLSLKDLSKEKLETVAPSDLLHLFLSTAQKNQVAGKDIGSQAGTVVADLGAGELPQSSTDTPQTRKEVQPAPETPALNSHLTIVERARLQTDIDALKPSMTSAEYNRLQNDLATFETRANKLGPTEVADTYYEISRMLESKAKEPTSPAERLTIAEQTLHHAACPQDIDQGNHYTCNVTVVESRIFSRNPSAAAHLISEVSTTGQYKSHDGSIIKIDPKSLRPDRESQDPPPLPKDNHRSYASQVFQVTAVNVFWQRQNEGPHLEGKDVVAHHPGKKGDWTYSQSVGPVPNADTGECLRLNGQVVTDNPFLYPHNLQDISAQIIGKTEPAFCLRAKEDYTSKDQGSVLAVESADDLKNKLLDLKRHGQLPAVITVNSRYEPYWSDTYAANAGGSGFPHVVTVSDISADGKTVSMVNEHGKASHHQLTVEHLYETMQNPDNPESIRALQHHVEKEDRTKITGWRDLEVLRLQIQSHAEPADTARQLDAFKRACENRWNIEERAHQLDPQEKERTLKEYNMLITWMKIHNQELHHPVPPSDLQKLAW